MIQKNNLCKNVHNVFTDNAEKEKWNVNAYLQLHKQERWGARLRELATSFLGQLNNFQNS